MSISIRDQVVVIVGASSGIGRAAAVLFAKEGAKTVAAARREDRLQSLKAELQRANSGIVKEIPTEIMVRRADATCYQEMEQLAQETLDRFGRIDILVYAAGTNIADRSMQRLTPELWNQMIDANLNGAFFATHAVLPMMRKARAGHLIYVSSVAAVQPDLSGAAYQAAKRGVLGLAHAVRLEEKQNGIRVCVLCPGMANTELVEKRPEKVAPELLAKALEPEDVAEAILYVAKLPPRVAIPEMQILPALL